MLRRSPPLSAIEAFLAAAKAPTFKDTALSLALSPSAFSRRIQALERLVGAPLFDQPDLERDRRPLPRGD